MIAFPSMLIGPARSAGMKVPEDPEEFNEMEYPHFSVFCKLQLGRAMRLGEQWDNAKVIAAIPEAEIKTMTLIDFLNKGLEWRT